MRTAGTIAGVLLAAMPRVGAAQPGATPAAAPAPAPAPAGSESTGYGWQILAADAAGLGLGLVAAESLDDRGHQRLGRVTSTAWAVGFTGSLAIHGAHRRPQFGLLSAGTRLLVPPVASVLGIAGNCVAENGERGCAGDGAAWGFAAGLATASAADALLFSELEGGGENRGFYGETTLVIDGVGFALGGLALAGADERPRAQLAALVIVFPQYLIGTLGAPWVHVARGKYGRALGSFALRLFLPAAGSIAGFAGYCAATSATDGCAETGAIFGFVTGTVAAAATDLSWLTWTDILHRGPGTGSPGGARVVPMVTRDAVGLSVVFTDWPEP